MKKTYLTLVFLIIFVSSPQAQVRKEYKWGLSFAINSIQAQVLIPLMINGGIVAIDADGNIIAKGERNDQSMSYSFLSKYYINGYISLRFEFAITNLNLKAHSEIENIISNSQGTFDVKSKTSIYKYAPGFQWLFLKEKKIESYCGMTLLYICYKPLNYYYFSEDINIATNTIRSSNEITDITPGGFATGFGVFSGFNIYLLKRISLGAELSYSVLYNKIGGEATQKDTEFNISGPNPANTHYTTYANSYQGFKISKITSSFNISFWF